MYVYYTKYILYLMCVYYIKYVLYLMYLKNFVLMLTITLRKGLHPVGGKDTEMEKNLPPIVNPN